MIPTVWSRAAALWIYGCLAERKKEYSASVIDGLYSFVDDATWKGGWVCAERLPGEANYPLLRTLLTIVVFRYIFLYQWFEWPVKVGYLASFFTSSLEYWDGWIWGRNSKLACYFLHFNGEFNDWLPLFILTIARSWPLLTQAMCIAQEVRSRRDISLYTWQERQSSPFPNPI